MKKLNIERLDRNRDVKREHDDCVKELDFGVDHEYEEYETDENDDYDDTDKNKTQVEILEEILTESLSQYSCDRGYLDFKYGDDEYRGVVMAKLKNSRYVFDVGGELKSFDINKIRVIK